MTEYINKAELLQETICKGILCSECSFNDDVKGARCKLIRYINELPTIKIVHCRDCKHRNTFGIDAIDCRHTSDN